MIETLEYIESYFTGQLSSTQKQEFEKRCDIDPEFAADVAFYVATRTELKNTLVDQKRKEFKELASTLTSQNSSTGILRKLYPYLTAAAACVILFIGWQVFFADHLLSKTPAQLATQYIKKNIEKPGVSMGADKDSLESAISAYNKKDFEKAEKIFSLLASGKNENSEAIKYLGFVYLVRKDYDKSLVQFNKLAERTDLYANPGLFYKAVTLMKRSGDGDLSNAKTILKEVIDKNLPGAKEARQWIAKM